MSTKKAKPKKTYGLKARDYPRNLRWAADADYLDKLSPEDRKWYAKFMEGHYGADSDALADWPAELRRQAYYQKNVSNRDLYGISDSVGLLHFPDEDEPEVGDPRPANDWRPTPEYLEDPEYRALLLELREAIDARPADPIRVANLRTRLEKMNGS